MSVRWTVCPRCGQTYAANDVDGTPLSPHTCPAPQSTPLTGSWLVRINDPLAELAFVTVVQADAAHRAILDVLGQYDTGYALNVTVTAERVAS